MPENKAVNKKPNTFERGTQVPTQNTVPKMPQVKSPASAPKTNSKGNK